MESYFNRGLLWISITKKSNSLLRIKVRRAMGIKAADQSNTLADGKVTAQLLSGQHCTTLFTVLSKSVEQHYQNSTAMLKFNTVFYLNAPSEDLRRKRLYFSVHASRDNNAGWDEMVGCFSLSFASLIDLSDHNTKLVNGWYFLLPSDVGRTQHVSAVGGNPRDLLQQVRCLTLDADDDADDEWNPSYAVVPNSDGSVCRGHVIQGQLETDIDAAFCCIPKEKVFPETKERRLEDSLHNVQCQLSALMEECEISDKVHMPKHSTAIRSNYADQSDSTNSNQSTESQRVDLHLFEIPSRFGNTSVKLRGKRKIKRDSLQILRRQLSFRSSSGYSSEHPSRESADSLETSVDSSVMGVNNSHKDLALRSSVSCCSKGVLFGVLKGRGRKMKSLKNTRMQQTSEESFDIASLSSISSNSVIATSLNESAFIARDEQLYSIDVDQSAPRRTDKFQRYLKTEPEFKNHVTVLAVQKRIIGFHRSSDRRKDLGFTVSDKYELEAVSAFVWAGYSRDNHNHRPTNLDSDTSIFKFQAPGTRRNHDSSCSDVSSRCRSNSSSSELSSSNELNMSHPPKPLDLSCQLSFDKLHELNLSSRVPPGHTSVASNNLKNEIYSYLRQIRNTSHSTIEDSSIKKNTANRLNTNIRNASFQHNIDYNSFANGRIRSSSFIDDASSSSSRSLFSSDSCSNCCSESSCSSCSRNNSFGSWDSGSMKVMGPRVVISRVAPGTAADDWGLLPGDGIVAVNHYDVRCASSLQIIRMLNDTDGEVVLEVERTGTVTWVH